MISPDSDLPDNLPAWSVSALAALVCGVALLGGALFGRSVMGGFDYLAIYYPMADYAQQSVREAGAYPLWLTSLFGGVPFTGSMAASLAPGEFANAFLGVPPPLFHAWSLLAHLVAASAGATLLLAILGLGGAAGVFGGLVYTFGCIVGTLPAVGHVNFIYGCAYLPWILCVALRPKAGLACLAGLLWGSMILGMGVQFAAFGFPWILLVLVLEAGRERRAAIGGAVLAMAVGAGVSAAWLLAAGGYFPHSVRAGLPGEHMQKWALVPGKLLELVWPGIWGRTSVVSGAVNYGPYGMDNSPLYVGLVPLALALVGAVHAWRRRLAWIVAGCVAVLFALGPETPWGRLLAAVPGYGSFRSWNRWLFFANVSLAVLLAEGWIAVRDGKGARKAFVAVAALVFAAAAAALAKGDAVTAMVMGTPWASGRVADGSMGAGDIAGCVGAALGRSAVFSGLALAAAIAVVAAKRRVAVSVLALVSLVDVLGVDREHLDLAPRSLVRSSDGVADFLSRQAGRFRVDTTEALYLPNMRIWRGAEYTTGYFGSPPEAVESYRRTAAKSGNMAGMLGVLNVRFLVREEEAAGDSLVPAGTAENGQGDTEYIFENRRFMPRIFFASRSVVPPWLSSPLEVMAGPSWRPDTAVISSPGFRGGNHARASAEIRRDAGGRLDALVRAEGASLAVVSVAGFPGWRAYLDGVRARILRADGLLMAVEIPRGRHELKMVFDPPLFRAGVFVSMVMLAFSAACAVPAVRRVVRGEGG